MENQINVGIQRQSYEAFEPIDSEAENSDANASLTDDSAGANTGSYPNSVSPHLEGESIHAAPPETAAATNTLNRYGVGDVVIMGRPAYAMPGYNSAGNTTTTPNSLPNQSVAARHDATSWMKEASISGSNDSGGSAYSDSYSDNDYGNSGDYGGGDSGGGAGDVGNGGGDGGSSSISDGTDNGGGNVRGNGDFDGGGDNYSGEDEADAANQPPTRIYVGDVERPQPCNPFDMVSPTQNIPNTTALERITVVASRSGDSNASSTQTSSASHGGSSNDYLSVDGYGVGSGHTHEGSNAGSTQGTSSNEYQNALDATSRLLNKPQGTVSYDDVLGALTQIRGASQNPELTMREQQALNSVFMAVYTRGNTERVIGPTVTNELLNAAVTSMMFGGGMARMPKPNLSTGPMLPRGNGTLHPIQGAHPANNGKPNPDGARYLANDYRFLFDGQGRVTRATASPLTLGTGTRDDAMQRGAGGPYRKPADQGGHIIGNQFKPPTVVYNYFAQNAGINQGSYRVLEMRWAALIRNGHSVEVEWRFSYPGNSTRPNGMIVSYRVDGGESIDIKFPNP